MGLLVNLYMDMCAFSHLHSVTESVHFKIIMHIPIWSQVQLCPLFSRRLTPPILDKVDAS